MENLWPILLAAGIPSALSAAIIGVIVRRYEKKHAKQEAAREQREQTRRAYELYQVKMLTATAGLCKANAIALQNGKCNGETHAALEHLSEVQHDQRDFLVSQGIDHLF